MFSTKSFSRVVVLLGAIPLVGWLPLAAPPVAAADYIEEPYPVRAPEGVDMGHAAISTEPGIVKIHLIGRYDTIGSGGPLAGGCRVMLGQQYDEYGLAIGGIEEQFVVLDDTGSGVATFRENEGAKFDGWCGSKTQLNGVTDLFAPHPDFCQQLESLNQQQCSARGYTVIMTGTGSILPPDLPKPAPYGAPRDTDVAGPDCEKLAADYDALPTGTLDVLSLMRALPGLSLIEPATLVACGILASAADAANPKPDPDANQQANTGICRGVESLAPLDTARDAVCGDPAS
jgi:hypothetical protein